MTFPSRRAPKSARVVYGHEIEQGKVSLETVRAWDERVPRVWTPKAVHAWEVQSMPDLPEAKATWDDLFRGAPRYTPQEVDRALRNAASRKIEGELAELRPLDAQQPHISALNALHKTNRCCSELRLGRIFLKSPRAKVGPLVFELAVFAQRHPHSSIDGYERFQANLPARALNHHALFTEYIHLTCEAMKHLSLDTNNILPWRIHEWTAKWYQDYEKA